MLSRDTKALLSCTTPTCFNGFLFFDLILVKIFFICELLLLWFVKPCIPHQNKEMELHTPSCIDYHLKSEVPKTLSYPPLCYIHLSSQQKVLVLW